MPKLRRRRTALPAFFARSKAGIHKAIVPFRRRWLAGSMSQIPEENLPEDEHLREDINAAGRNASPLPNSTTTPSPPA
jgi:hypothetical protein